MTLQKIIGNAIIEDPVGDGVRTCPYCGSEDIITHTIQGIAPGDQDYEKVCMTCGKSW